MANLIITNNCQRNCVYCFAQGDKNNGQEFTWDNFLTAAKFIATGYKAVNLLGGEPTLHKDFCRMLDYLINEDYFIQVFTNGMLTNNDIDRLSKTLHKNVLREHQLSFAVNVNEDKYRTSGETKLQENFLEAFSKFSYPSFTIHDENVDLTFLSELIDKFNLDRTIRLGLSMPVFGVNNKYLPITSYRNAAESIKKLSESTKEITIKFDCGFPLCMFTLKEISELSQYKKNDFAFLCGQPLDIYPDLTISNCFALSKLHKIEMSNFSSMGDANLYFSEGFMTPEGIYGDKCVECPFFRRVCFGGCKGFYKP